MLDDSIDETTALAMACIDRHRAQGLDIELLHRVQRPGFKAGALAAAQPQATGEFIAIFDADFVPPSDFLRRTVPHLLVDPKLGFLQTRWAHLNERYSALTGAQALALDGHFIVEQTVRQRSGWFFGFNGTAGLWRRTCIDDAGGWQIDTLCEDLDLSYRAQLAAGAVSICPTCRHRLDPPQLAALKRQQSRWATGSIQAFRKLSGQVVRARRPLPHTAEALVHLGAYFCHPLMLLLLLLTLPLLWFGDTSANPLRWLLTYLGLASVGPPLLYAISQWELHGDEPLGQGWLRRLLSLPLLVLMGTGLALSNSVAVARGLSNQMPEFRRTPKFHLQDPGDQWQDKRYALPLSGLVLGEMFLSGYALVTVIVASARGQFYAVPFLMLYVLGFGMMVVVGLVQGWQRRRPQRRFAGRPKATRVYAE